MSSCHSFSGLANQNACPTLGIAAASMFQLAMADEMESMTYMTISSLYVNACFGENFLSRRFITVRMNTMTITVEKGTASVGQAYQMAS